MSKPPNDAPNPFVGAQFILSCAQLHQLPADDLPEIAFAGRSNAGKSSALNTLCGQNHLARVSKTPGRTQLINMFSVPDGRFADLPGYGYAKVARELRAEWGRLIGAYMDGRQNLRAAVLIMDIRHTLTDFDWQMLEWAQHRGLACHALLTKADKLGFGAAKNTLLAVRKAMKDAGLENATAQLFSSTNGLGLQEARETLRALLMAGAEPQA